MYTLVFNDAVIYDPRAESLSIREPDVHLAANSPGSMSFVIDAGHPYAGQLTKLLGTLELRQDGAPVYRGRILRDEMDLYNSRRIETEGLLAALNDSIIPPFTFPGVWYSPPVPTTNVVELFLGWILSQHNAQVTEDRQIKLGIVTVEDSNNYIRRSASDYLTSWEVIKSRLLESALGGYLLPRYEADGTYLDYLREFTQPGTQTVEFGENLLALTSAVDATDVYTALLPLGADGLTIHSLPDGEIAPGIIKSGRLVYSSAGRAQYGNITRTAIWDDVTDAENLQAKAAAQLQSAGVRMTNSIALMACDLHYADSEIENFRIGCLVPVLSAPHGLSSAYPLMEMDLDILNPANTQITLGATELSQSDRNQTAQAKLNELSQTASLTGQELAEMSAQINVIAGKIDGLDDYVVDHEQIAGWQVRKWNSGAAECWTSKTFNSVPVTTAAGSLFSGEIPGQALPITFARVSASLAEVTGAAFGSPLSNEYAGSYTPVVKLLSPVSGAYDITVQYLVRGEWR